MRILVRAIIRHVAGVPSLITFLMIEKSFGVVLQWIIGFFEGTSIPKDY